MSDARDAVAEAVAANKKLAASLLVRKQELEAQLEAAPDAASAEAIGAELARIDEQYRAALTELNELRRLGARAPVDAARAVVAAATASDPVLQSDEERALALAREHLAELEAQVELGEEPTSPGSAADAVAKRPMTREEADAQARAEFEALRAKRFGGPGGTPTSAPTSAPTSVSATVSEAPAAPVTPAPAPASEAPAAPAVPDPTDPPDATDPPPRPPVKRTM